jgi:hypothetical protein
VVNVFVFGERLSCAVFWSFALVVLSEIPVGLLLFFCLSGAGEIFSTCFVVLAWLNVLFGVGLTQFFVGAALSDFSVMLSQFFV